MRNLNKELYNRKIDYDKLVQYGFLFEDKVYIYEKYILNREFKIIIEVDKDEMTSKLIECFLNDEYLMVDIESAQGEYVGKIKEEYNNVINDVIEKCTIKDIFKSKQAIEVIKYIKDKYNDELEYLWTKFPNNAIWRNDENNKWYGALLILEERKLGIDSDRVIEIIDLRYQKDNIKEIIDNKEIYQGYHMNKDSWITIKLDGTVDINKIFKLIDNSYNISLEK